ncbi:MAG: hypothetical protein ABEJ04_06440 [Halobacteriaceae archaeon]
MFDGVRKFEFYHDSEAESPREDPEEIDARLEEVADEHGVDYERVDVADVPDDEWEERYETLVGAVDPDRYHVGNRIFTSETFGRLRPVLVVRYDDADFVDLYPHQNDDVTNSTIRIGDFLDEVQEDATSDRGDYARLRERDAAEAEADGETDSSAADSSDGLIATIKRHVT